MASTLMQAVYVTAMIFFRAIWCFSLFKNSAVTLFHLTHYIVYTSIPHKLTNKT